MKKIFLSLVCMVALLATTSCGGSSATPSDSAKEWIELIKAKDYEGFVETIQPSEKATPEEAEQAKQMYLSLFKDKGDKQIEKKGGIASYSILSETISEDGKTAKVECEIVYGNGKTDKQSFDMVLVDGKWKQTIKK